MWHKDRLSLRQQIREPVNPQDARRGEEAFARDEGRRAWEGWGDAGRASGRGEGNFEGPARETQGHAVMPG